MRLLFLIVAALLALSPAATVNADGAVRPMAALRGLIGRAIADHAKQIIIPPGVYRGGPAAGSPIILPLQNVQNLKIIAHGVEMVCTMRTRALFFDHCKNVELDGLTIDYDPLTFTQGTVTGIAPNDSWLDITLDAGYPRLPFERIMLIDPRTQFIQAGMPFFWGSTSAMIGPNVARVTLPGIGKSARRGMLATLSDGNEAGGVCHGVTLEHCRGGMVLNGLTLYCAPGMGIVEYKGAGRTRLRNVRIVPGPPPPGGTRPRLLTTSWDGILGSVLDHGQDVENCTLRDCGDDSWSDQSTALLVLKSDGAKLILAGDADLVPGDHLRQSLVATPFTVTTAQRIPIAQAGLDAATLERLDKPAQYSLWAIDHDTVQTVTTARAAALPIGASVYAPEHQGSGFIFRNNTVHSQGRILIKASDGLIEGNTIVGCHNVAVSPEVPQGGAFGIENLVFKDNRIVGAEYTDAMPWSTQAGALCVASADPGSRKNALAPAGSFRNIVIQGNTFEDVSAANVWLAGVRGATVEANRFVRPDDGPLSVSGQSYGVDNAAVVLLRHCDQVRLSGNRVVQPGPYVQTLLSTDASDTRVTTVRRAGAAAPSKSWIADPTYGMPMPHLAPPAKATATAHWIWLGPVVGDQQFHARTVFTLHSPPRSARLWITGDDAFTVFLNGHQIDQTQPIEQGWSRPHQDIVAPDLHTGRNVIAVTGVNKGGGAAGVLVDLDINGVPAVVSGRRWKARLTTAPPPGWQNASFDDAGWQDATDEGIVGTGVWGRNVTGWPRLDPDAWYMAHVTRWPVAVETLSGPGTAQGLASLRQPHRSAHVVITPASASAGPTQILLDFGRELSGRIRVAGTEGATVQVHTGESRAACLRILQDPRLLAIDNSGPWPLTLHGEDAQTTPDTAFRYALLTFPGNRPVTLTEASCDFKYYPVQYKGSFACSDPLLTKIWYTGAYTAHLCMQEDIWDAPKRDRGLWIGDLHVSGETINDAFADKFLMEKTIAGGRAEAQGGRPDTQMPTADINNIPGYTASWFGVLADFYRHSGDLAFLKSQYAGILSLLAYQQTEFDGRHLFTNPQNEWDFCDWAPGYVRGTPQTLAATDLFDIYGVRQAVFLLRALGDTANAARYAAWADTLTQAARSQLADPRTQTYGDRVQENAMAVYADVATPEQRAQIYNAVLKAGTAAWAVPSSGDLAGSEVMSPYYGSYVLRAYGELGQYQAGIDLLRRYWGAMLARGTTTWWECFDPSFPPDMNAILPKMPYLSLCHGWSSGPTSFLTECILGVQPTSGGFNDVLIQPELCDLTWAAGTVPTPHGDIILHVEKRQHGTVCTLTLPRGIHALVNLPGKTVTLDHAGKYTLKG